MCLPIVVKIIFEFGVRSRGKEDKSWNTGEENLGQRAFIGGGFGQKIDLFVPQCRKKERR